MEDQILDDFKEGMDQDMTRNTWIRIGLVVLLASLIHLFMVVFKEYIPEPFLDNEVKISVHGALILVVMLCQSYILCPLIEVISINRRVILNALLVAGFVMTSEMLFYLMRDIYYNYEFELTNYFGHYLWLIIFFISPISFLKIKKLRGSSNKRAWWGLILFWVVLSQLNYHLNWIT